LVAIIEPLRLYSFTVHKRAIRTVLVLNEPCALRKTQAGMSHRCLAVTEDQMVVTASPDLEIVCLDGNGRRRVAACQLEARAGNRLGRRICLGRRVMRKSGGCAVVRLKRGSRGLEKFQQDADSAKSISQK